MVGESYTLREVAELLGVSKRTLQRRIQEGAFAGRFLAPGRHGLETRVPASEVQRVLDDLRQGGAPAGEAVRTLQETRLPTVTPSRELHESLVPYGEAPGSALTQSDLESLRDAMLALVREDRESFVAVVRESLLARDREMMALRAQVSALQSTLDKLRKTLDSGDGSPSRRPIGALDTGEVTPDQRPGPGGAPPPGGGAFEVDALLREIDDIESLLVTLGR